MEASLPPSPRQVVQAAAKAFADWWKRKPITRGEYAETKKSLRNRNVSPVKKPTSAAARPPPRSRGIAKKPARKGRLPVVQERLAQIASEEPEIDYADAAAAAASSSSTNGTAEDMGASAASSSAFSSRTSVSSLPSSVGRGKGKALQKMPSVVPGSRIVLLRCESEMNVVRYDAVAQRYLLRDSAGREFSEVLEGHGKVHWELVSEPTNDLVAEQGAGSPTDVMAGLAPNSLEARLTAEAQKVKAQKAAAPVCFSTRTARRTGICGGKVVDQKEYPECPVCLDDITSDIGLMKCCGSPIHRTCAAAWRRSNLKNDSRGANRGLKDEWKFDTRKCVCCNHLHEGGGTSVRRMFGDED
jgi:hypothetical protein